MTGTGTTSTGAVIDRRPPPAIGPRITPLALLGGRHASRVLERNVLVYRRSWIFLVSGFFEPLFYLLSIGIGLSHLVGPIPVDGQLVAYTAFVAPGLLASSAMNGAMIDSTFQIFFKLKIAKTYDAMLATPLGVGDVAIGELCWCVLRVALYSSAFLAIMAILGYVVSPWALLCWPAAILTGLAFASAGMAGTTYMRTWQDFDMVSLAFIPLFLFSATFYPLYGVPGLAAGRGPLHAALPGRRAGPGGRPRHLEPGAAGPHRLSGRDVGGRSPHRPPATGHAAPALMEGARGPVPYGRPFERQRTPRQ